ncbi:unnamed protein product [Porites evermanni]|uniref:Uncharacterized protein n=1 Tax=Porites evermanni TaxID=104178 RepID=A0ABN8M1P5_9CNID|nr:unnamed protein product [Porites evermanni]
MREIERRSMWYYVQIPYAHSNSNSWMEMFRGRGLGYFYKGKLRSKVQPHTLSYTIWQKRYPFRIPFIDKWYPFHIPSLRLSIPFKLLQTHCL